nr:copia protein [Tanacetum cinerariifolium]
MNKNFYNSNSSGFDQSQLSQFPVIHQPPQEMSIQEMEDLKQQYLDEMKRLINSNILANLSTYPSKHFNSFCYDDDDDDEAYTIAVTPSLSTEEPDNSLSMKDDHLDTILATESDEFIKSSFENLIPIPSESEGILDNISEVMKIVILEVGGIDDDILLTNKDDILRKKLLNINLLIAKIEALNDNPTPSSNFMTKSSSTSLNSLLEETNTFDNSLPEFETFCFDLEEISSGSTTTRFEDPDFPDRVYKVEKALYRFHQAPRAWKEMCTEFEQMMHKKFQMSSIGELTFFLGLQGKQKEDGIFISQEKYVNEILNKFGYSNVKTASTPMETHKTFLKDEKGKDLDEHLYKSMIGSLMYLTSSRPDIMFVVCACARFQVNPKISHLHAVKRSKNINGEAQIHAKMDGKNVLVFEATIRRDLKFLDEGGVDCLSNAIIFEQLTLMGWSGDNVADEAFNAENVSQHSNDPLLNGEDSIQLKELMEIYTKLQQRVLDLETTKTNQAIEIDKLKRSVKNLEKKQGSRTHKLKRLYKVSLSARIESSNKEQSLGEEDASKQRRNIADIDVDAKITLVNETVEDQGRDKKSKPKVDKVVIKQEQEQGVTTTTTTVVTISTPASTRPKARSVVMQEPSETTTPPQIKAKDKGKESWHEVQAKMEADYELAQRLQAEEQEQLTDAKKTRLFMDFLEKRMNFFTAKREIKKSSKKTKAAEGNSKRAGEEIEQESFKRQKVDDNQETTKLKRCLEIVPNDGDDLTIHATPLSSKSPTIVDYKIYKEGRKIEKMYPHTRNTLHWMWNDVRLQVDYEEPEAPEEAPPSLDYVPRPEHPPSPNCIPGHENPPSLLYVPEPEYPEYLVSSNAEVAIKDQPLPADALPTGLSSGYAADSDSEEDSKDDIEKDPADYPANGGDDDDDNESFGDDVDDEDEEASKDEDTEAFETDESAPTPPLSIPRRARIFVRLPSPMAASLEARITDYYHLLHIGLIFPRLRCHLKRELASLLPLLGATIFTAVREATKGFSSKRSDTFLTGTCMNQFRLEVDVRDDSAHTIVVMLDEMAKELTKSCTKVLLDGLDEVMSLSNLCKLLGTSDILLKCLKDKISKDVLTIGSTMRILLLYRGEYSQWVERFMNNLEEQKDGEAMINSIKNGDQPLPRVTQVSVARTTSIEQPPLKDKSMWKAAVLYEYETFKATEGELLLDTYIRYLQVISDLKKYGYSKDNCELNFKFLNNLQPKRKQYATMMRQNKNLMDINIDALYNILK